MGSIFNTFTMSLALLTGFMMLGHDAKADTPTARAVIRSISKDADALKFRNEFDSPTVPGIKCGEVNGKNSFGAYTGFKRFIVQRNKALLDDGTLPKFNQGWLDLCTKKK